MKNIRKWAGNGAPRRLAIYALGIALVAVIPTICFAQVSTLSKAVRISDSMEPALVRLAHQECGGRGVGAIGMCLTGGFALSMALDPVVLAPVLAQPGLPVTRRSIQSQTLLKMQQATQ